MGVHSWLLWQVSAEWPPSQPNHRLGEARRAVAIQTLLAARHRRNGYDIEELGLQ
ncbi:hypothetical protein [Nitrosomonas sp. ANs5]|uniref:hypothetical protein n=1 Tax=Nitrosomonas sp. ANs5 TaxID=3423941 RepID=UPI003D326305